MPKFNYTALNKEGKKESSSLEAASVLEAGHWLKQQGLMPIDLREAGGGSFLAGLKEMSAISLAQKIVFIQNLSIMLKAGISAARALKIITQQTHNAKFKKVLDNLASAVEAGKSLHEAMAEFPGVFSYIFISMIKVGEVSGGLDKSLEYLSIQLTREADLKSKVRGAMIYPLVIVGAMVLIGILMAIFVLPKLVGVFKEANVDLPFLTRILIGFTDFFSAHIILAPLVLILIVGAVVAALFSASGKQILAAAVIKMPILGLVAIKINLARFSRVLSSLLKSGIPIVEGLQVASESVGNPSYKTILAEASSQVKLGKPLTSVLAANEKLFPYIVVQMLEVGEETGTMETILEQLAQHFETEVDDTLKNLSSIVEPLLLLVIGAVVGLLAAALILPIYNISQTIQ